MIVTALWVILVAWYFGLRERARLGRLAAERIGAPPPGDDPEIRGAVDPGKRKYFWVNLAITVALKAALLTDLMPLAVLLMLAYDVTATLHYPSSTEERSEGQECVRSCNSR